MKKNPSSKAGFFTPRFFLALVLCSSATGLAMFSFATPAGFQKGSVQRIGQFKPAIFYSSANGISPRVVDLPTIKKASGEGWESHAPLRIHPLHAAPQLPVNDPVQQTTMPALAIPAPLQTFEGMNQAEGCGNCIPPDPNGAVGPNHYVEMVNSSYSVYTKTGTRLVGPVDINALWSNLPGRCQVNNDGDPVVVYDHLADRWVLSQFAVNGGNGPFAQCIAVSTSPDPTGSYYVYEFDQNGFNDYPKLGVWPDAYYMTSNQFNGTGGTFSGAGAFAFERDKMLAGQPARMIFFDEGLVDSNFGGMLPSHLDGAPPPLGSPDYFAEVDSQINTPGLGADAMRIWQFHVDWSNTANSTFGINGQPNSVLPVAMWNPSQCVEGQGTCVPQEGSPYQLDVIGDRLMFRLVYRNFGDHESLVVNHSVIADARIGVRWYEVRSPGSSPVIFQQSTFAPVDTLYRWMGSIAMDHLGDIAAAYSTSSATSFPSMAYAGRLAGDPLNQFSQGENQLWAGQGSENVAFYIPPVGRWGDYSDLTVDPTDGCTFWYVNEYFGSLAETDGGAPWQTRIGSFKFSQCVASPVTLISVASRKVHGNAGAYDVNLPITGTPGIECRSGGANGNYTLVYTFANPLTNVADATVTSGTGTISGSGIGTDAHQYIVNLTGVTNAQTITVNLTNVYDSTGNSSSVVSAPMSVLTGDTNADGSVNSADISQTKSQSGNAVTNSNFREDVTVDGFLNSADISLVKSKSGTALP
jgi:Dockerin type I domain